MWPRVRRISDDRRTASEKSEVKEVRAARNKLPKLWPSRPDPFSKRWRKSLESRASSSLNATMQLRMSPGGRMLNSLRRRPLEPPSSLTVTTAERSRMTEVSDPGQGSSLGPRTKRLSPLRRVESPVPPPIATTRIPPADAVSGVVAGSEVLVPIGKESSEQLDRFFLTHHAHRSEFAAGIGIKQFSKAWILGEVLEVGIIAGLEAQLRIEAERFVQTAERILNVARQAIERGQAINDVVGFGVLLQQLFQVLPGSDVIADIHQRNGVVEVLFWSLELRCRGALQVLVAGVQMYVGAVGQLLARSGNDLLEIRLGLVELVFLHGAQPGLVTLQGLGVARIFRHGLLRGGFLSHVQNSSCALGNRELLAIAFLVEQ